MAKKTTLSENASIYQRREDVTERQKWDQMDKSEKWQYFKDYYLMKLIILIFSIGFVGYLLYATLGPRDIPELYGMVLNDTLEADGKDSLLSNFRESLEIPKKGHSFTLDDTLTLNPENADVVTEQKLTTYAYASKLDIIIADEDTIKYLAKGGYLSDLTQILPSDLYSSNTDDLIFARGQDDTKDVAYGLSIDDSAIYKQMSYNYSYNTGKKMAIGIVTNSEKRDNAIEFIRYLLNTK